MKKQTNKNSREVGGNVLIGKHIHKHSHISKWNFRHKNYPALYTTFIVTLTIPTKSPT